MTGCGADPARVSLSRKWRGRTQPPCYTSRAMEHIEVSIRTDGAFRATEVIADLRNVAETLFNPMRLVGFWDQQAGGMHLCPQEQLGRECPHNLPPDDPRRVDYATTAGGEMRRIPGDRIPPRRRIPVPQVIGARREAWVGAAIVPM